ncbi:MAG: hypothetical protein ABI277_05645 [Burkholderiaceae bacterium]
MSIEQQQLQAGIAALEAQRALLGDAVVNASVAAMRTQLVVLESAGPVKLPEASQALR